MHPTEQKPPLLHKNLPRVSYLPHSAGCFRRWGQTATPVDSPIPTHVKASQSYLRDISGASVELGRLLILRFQAGGSLRVARGFDGRRLWKGEIGEWIEMSFGEFAATTTGHCAQMGLKIMILFAFEISSLIFARAVFGITR